MTARPIAAVLLLAIVGSGTLIVTLGYVGVAGLVGTAFLPGLAFAILYYLERDTEKTRFALNKGRLMLMMLVGYTIELLGQLLCPGLGVFGDGVGSALGGALCAAAVLCSDF